MFLPRSLYSDDLVEHECSCFLTVQTLSSLHLWHRDHETCARYSINGDGVALGCQRCHKMTAHKRARLSSLSPSPGVSELQPIQPSNTSPALTSYSSSLSWKPHTNTASSSFRNVSACNRCRVRKNRCDQKLPACSPCEKVGVKCAGFDPITKREIPRTYVYYLESRVSYLEGLLTDHGIAYGAPQDFHLGAKPIEAFSVGQLSDNANDERSRNGHTSPSKGGRDYKRQESEKLDKLVSNIGMVSVQGASDSRFLGSTSGISFARVVLASLPNTVSGKKGSGRSKPSANAPSMRGTCFNR